MALRKQIWKPDTCDCMVEETYDPEQDASTWTAVPIRKCAAHVSVTDGDLYNVLYQNADGENKRKNVFIRMALGYEIGDFGLAESKIDANGNTYVDFKAGISVSWSFSGSGDSRVLNITITGASLNNAQKNAISTFCTNRFGAGKVNVTYI